MKVTVSNVSSYVLLSFMITSIIWGESLPGFPIVIDLNSDIRRGRFAPNGEYHLEDSPNLSYVNKKGCKIMKIQGLDSCGPDSECESQCFNNDCYEAFCPDEKNGPRTIFMECKQEGPQTCESAEFVSYEEMGEWEIAKTRIPEFTIKDVSDNFRPEDNKVAFVAIGSIFGILGILLIFIGLVFAYKKRDTIKKRFTKTMQTSRQRTTEFGRQLSRQMSNRSHYVDISSSAGEEMSLMKQNDLEATKKIIKR